VSLFLVKSPPESRDHFSFVTVVAFRSGFHFPHPPFQRRAKFAFLLFPLRPPIVTTNSFYILSTFPLFTLAIFPFLPCFLEWKLMIHPFSAVLPRFSGVNFGASFPSHCLQTRRLFLSLPPPSQVTGPFLEYASARIEHTTLLFFSSFVANKGRRSQTGLFSFPFLFFELDVLTGNHVLFFYPLLLAPLRFHFLASRVPFTFVVVQDIVMNNSSLHATLLVLGSEDLFFLVLSAIYRIQPFFFFFFPRSLQQVLPFAVCRFAMEAVIVLLPPPFPPL